MRETEKIWKGVGMQQIIFLESQQITLNYIDIKQTLEVQLEPMTLRKLLIQFLLIVFAFSLCADPTQPENKCTSCVPLDILIGGTCYTKIKGCLRHNAGPICEQCQFGYVFTNSTCIREAVFYGNNNLSTIPPVQIVPPSLLSYEDIRNKLGEKYGDHFTAAHEYFLAKYTTQLGKGNIKNVQTLQTKTGVFVIILYESDSKKNYQAVSFKDNLNNFKEWSFGLFTGIKRDPFTADNLIRLALGDKLKDYVLYQLNQEGDFLIFDYIGRINDIVRVTVNRNDISSPLLASKLQLKNISLTDLAVQKIRAMYPAYRNIQVSSIQRIDEFYIINFGLSISVSFKFNNYNFVINKPLEFPVGAYVSADSAFRGVSTNGFSAFTDTSNQQFLSSAQYLVKQFPEVTGSQVTKIQSQPVNTPATLAFLLNMKKTVGNVTDEYQVLLWFNTSKLTNIILARKNNKTIFEEYYNYNIDANFLSNYKIVESESRIINIPPISSVSLKLVGSKKLYKVSYSASEFAEFQYQTDTGKVYLLTYFIDGQNILQTLFSKRSIAEKRSTELLLTFIKSKIPSSDIAQIKQIQYNLPTYLVSFVTDSGTFKAVVDDKGTELVLSQYSLISNLTCFDLKVDDAQASEKVKTIDTFLKQNYPLSGYSIQIVQVNVQKFSLAYRILYSNTNLKQITVNLEQMDGIVNVIRVAYANYGYEILNPDPLDQDYAKIASILKQSDFVGSKVSFFNEINSTVIKAYYEDGKSTYEIYYDKNTAKATSQILSTRSYLLVPDGFSLPNLLLPGTPSIADSAMISKILQQVLKKFTIVVRDSTLVFADKVNNVYNLMYKASNGYQKLQATFNQTDGTFTFSRIIVLPYSSGDFSNCQKFDKTGKCLSCDLTKQVEFQGACHKKIDGCLIQPGAICVKCNTNYIKQDLRCYKDCENFFR